MSSGNNVKKAEWEQSHHGSQTLLLGLGIQWHSTRWGKGRQFAELLAKGASSQTCIAFIFSITCVSRAIWPNSEIKSQQ